MELGGEGQMVWCQVGGSTGKWCLGTVVGTRKRKVVVSVEKTDHDFDPKELTQVRHHHLPRSRTLHSMAFPLPYHHSLR